MSIEKRIPITQVIHGLLDWLSDPRTVDILREELAADTNEEAVPVDILREELAVDTNEEAAPAPATPMSSASTMAYAAAVMGQCTIAGQPARTTQTQSLRNEITEIDYGGNSDDGEATLSVATAPAIPTFIQPGDRKSVV